MYHSFSTICMYVFFQKSREHPSEQQTTVDVTLARVDFNADVTLLDRLQPLLNASSQSKHTSLRTTSLEKMKQSLYMTSSNIQTINLVGPTNMYMSMLFSSFYKVVSWL